VRKLRYIIMLEAVVKLNAETICRMQRATTEAAGRRTERHKGGPCETSNLGHSEST